MPKPYKLNMRQAVLTHYNNGALVVKIKFPFNPEDIAIVKTIPGRKWNPEARFWTCPPTSQAVKILDDAKFVIDQKLRAHLKSKKVKVNLATLVIPGLKKKLFAYQNEGVAFIESRNGRALIGDDMGLGKTVQAIAWLQLNPQKRPAIIVVPASVKLNWQKEIVAWMGAGPNKVQIITGRKISKLSGNIIIINYDIIEAWLKPLIAFNPQVVICDEIQYCKGSTHRTKAVRKLSRHVPHFIGLSGTPIVNRPIELFNAIQMIDNTIMPNWQTYVRRYCDAKHNGFGLVVNGASNTQELHELLSQSIMLRRTKKEVLTDLPDKTISFFPLEMEPALEKEYNEAEDNFLEWMKTRRGAAAAERASFAQALAEIEVLKQVAVEAKLPHAIEWIDDFLDTGEKLVVFCTHKFVVDAIMKEFSKEAVKLDGRTSGPDRQLAVDKFQNKPETRLFVGNIKAAGVGITLTAASSVAFLELPWTPGDLAQAAARVDRIGQKNAVNVYYLLAEYTIEEKIAALLDEKMKVLDSVLDGKETEDSSLIMDLIENY